MHFLCILYSIGDKIEEPEAEEMETLMLGRKDSGGEV